MTAERERVLEEAREIAIDALRDMEIGFAPPDGMSMRQKTVAMAQQLIRDAFKTALSSPLRPEGEAAPEIDFTAEEFADLAHRLRSVADQAPTLKAMLSNNYNVLLGALDAAALSARPQPPQQPVANLEAIARVIAEALGQTYDELSDVRPAEYPENIKADYLEAAEAAIALYAAPLAQPVAMLRSDLPCKHCGGGAATITDGTMRCTSCGADITSTAVQAPTAAAQPVATAGERE